MRLNEVVGIFYHLLGTRARKCLKTSLMAICVFGVDFYTNLAEKESKYAPESHNKKLWIEQALFNLVRLITCII
jgi:hypothetical protein